MESPVNISFSYVPAFVRRIASPLLCGAALAAAVAVALAAAPGANSIPMVRPATASHGIDVLDLPARASALSLKRPLSGIAAQGATMLAVGGRGIILVSRDSGASWTQASVPLTSDLATVRFTAPGVAWAVGHDGVALKSSDAGRTWTRVLDGRSLYTMLQKHYQALADAGNADAAALVAEVTRAAEQSATPGVLSYPFLDIRIAPDGEGFLVGAFGLLLHTADAGATWEPWLERAANERRMHLYAVEQAPDGAFLIAGEQGLLRRYDAAAKRFVAVTTPYDGTFFGLSSGAAGLVAFGLRGNVFISSDDAATWTRVPVAASASVVAALACGPGRLALVTQAGQVLVSRDGGASVEETRAPRGLDVAGAVLARPGQLALAGAGGARLLALPGCGLDAPRLGKN